MKVLDYAASKDTDKLMDWIKSHNIKREDIQSIACSGSYILLFYWKEKEDE